MTINNAIKVLNENKDICNDVVFETPFLVSLTIKWENKKGREMAKFYGFKFNGLRKTWEKVTDRINWQAHTRADGINL